MKTRATRIKKRTNHLLLFHKFILLFFPLFCNSQTDTNFAFTFDFNDHKIKEKNDKVVVRSMGTSMTTDRFDNDNSAVYLHGHNFSYLNLGTSKFYKSPIISISLWINLEIWVRSGKGYEYNPILIIKNGPGHDWINALSISYEGASNRFTSNSTRDSTHESIVHALDHTQFNKWYHLVLVCNNNYLAFYVNGVLQGKLKKQFETKFLETDSLVIGHSANTKNERFMRGIVDDIKIFHRSLTDKDVQELYNAPNPNRFKNILNECLKYGAILLLLSCVIIILLIRNKRQLARQREHLELINKLSQMELKAVKAQMNPHFVSNCLVAIQDLIYSHNIENAGLYVAKFSFFLRQVLNYSDENYISLAEEVEMIKLYVELEQLRFKDKFKFELIIDASLDQQEVSVPALITQPFIENAIWHGLLPLKDGRVASLKVKVLKRPDSVTIEIEDNGVGRSLTKKESAKSKGTQLALDKIESLNRLAGNNNFKIEILDLQDEQANQLGTKIMIHIMN